MIQTRTYDTAINSVDIQRYDDALTTATTALKAKIRVFFHHICLLTVLAPRLKAVAWLAMLSVLSTSNSMRSPRLRICSTFWTMMSFTWASWFWAFASSSEGGLVLYVCMSCEMTGENDPWRPYAGVSAREPEEEVA